MLWALFSAARAPHFLRDSGCAETAYSLAVWGVFALTLLAPVLWIHQWRSGGLRVEQMALVIPMLAFAYFLGALSLVSWLPRYSIPIRPLSYVLAAASLSQLTTLALQRGSRGFADRNPSSTPG